MITKKCLTINFYLASDGSVSFAENKAKLEIYETNDHDVQTLISFIPSVSVILPVNAIFSPASGGGENG